MLRGYYTNVSVFAFRLCAVALLSATLTSNASAQTPAQQQTPALASTDAPQPDLSITARVTARELRFEKVPNPKVEFTGRPRRDTVWEAERENLPEQVQPGVTYRNIGITLRITSVFADIDRIVAEALGEIPLSDDATPTQQGAASELPATQPATATTSQSAAPAAQRPRTTRKGRGN